MLPSTGGSISLYELPSLFPSFGTNVETYTLVESTEGSVVGFNNTHFYLPTGYVSETPISASMTIVNHNFDSFNLMAGESYSVSWAVGTADEDSLTVNIVPEPSSILLIGTAGGLLALARQKRKTR